MQPPVLIAAIQEVEEDRLRHDRDARIADRKATSGFAQPGLDAACGVETESRTAGENEGIDLFDRHRWVEQGGIAPARRTAENGARGNRRLVENDGGNARSERQVGGVANGEAFDIGDEIEQVGPLWRRLGAQRQAKKKTGPDDDGGRSENFG